MSAKLVWQRWFAAAGLAVALLLGLSGAVGTPFLLPLVLVSAVMAASPRPQRPLPTWLENLLAPLIVVAVVAAGGVRFGVLRPVANLLALLAAVRLWGGAERERRGSVVLLLAVLNAAGIASSTHPSLVLYLGLLLVGIVVAAGQLVPQELAAKLGVRPPGGLPPARLVASTAVLAVVVAVPLFVTFPRLRSPFATAGMGARPVSGFREAVSLHQLGEIKSSRRPMLRVRFAQPEGVEPHWLRFAGATLTHYRAGRWIESRKRAPGGEVPLLTGTPGPVTAEITLEQSSDRLFLPPGASHLVPPDASVWVDGAEAVRIPRALEPPIVYRVSFHPEAVNTRPPGPDDLVVVGDQSALKRLLREAVGDLPDPLRRAQALERFLQTKFSYSASTNAPIRADPVEWFLFTARQGHCEFFASAMVLLLRVDGIPARLQTGFAGGQSLGAGEYLLRDANAHAWVLAHIDGRWHIFDPTPPEGRPETEAAGGGFDLRAFWVRVESFWDRWIITFSLADQLEVLAELWDGVRRAGRWMAAVGALMAVVGAGVFWLLRRRKQARKPQRVSELGRLLWRLAQAAGWDEEALQTATPSQVRSSLLLRLSASREACLRLFSAHEQLLCAGAPPPPRRRLVADYRQVLAELRQREPEPGPTTTGQGASSREETGSLPVRPPRSGR